MEAKEYILKLLYRAFLDIRIASHSQNSQACFILSDVFHNIPLQLISADKGETSYDDIITCIQKRCEERECLSWFHTASSNIVRSYIAHVFEKEANNDERVDNIDKLSLLQKNNLIAGVDLAAEIEASSPERRAFIVVGAYLKEQSDLTKSIKYLNVKQDNLRFWLRKYEVSKKLIENDMDITQDELINSIHVRDIQTIEQLEDELKKYIQDFSLLEASWKVDTPFP